MEGVLYCKPHFEQLFKESGSFNKNFQSPTKLADKTTHELVKCLILQISNFIIYIYMLHKFIIFCTLLLRVHQY
ncbi:LIM domain-containing protein WLIM2b [Glycine soja]|uniref:LIM domain-containing protein WLIM2b n=1 Tax=Glycine soja TaxID=3848 RepID=A0A445M333_GLYSO|nr:LIM domain-containing protein WLIM2b [Glycine soja]